MRAMSRILYKGAKCMLKKFLLVSVLAVPCLCMAQESSKMDVSINVNGLFPSHSENNGLGQSASASGGVLASFRYSPSRFATFEFNYGHSRDTQYFSNAGVQSFVHTGVHEVTGAYVLNLPWHTPRLQPFALVGAGIMQFSPFTAGTSVSGAQCQTKPAVLWGAGVDYDVSRHLALRLQYRGLFYAGPDFKVVSLKTDRWQPMAQPSFGIVYRF